MRTAIFVFPLIPCGIRGIFPLISKAEWFLAVLVQVLQQPRIVCYSEKPLTFAERLHTIEDMPNVYAYVTLVLKS